MWQWNRLIFGSNEGSALRKWLRVHHLCMNSYLWRWKPQWMWLLLFMPRVSDYFCVMEVLIETRVGDGKLEDVVHRAASCNTHQFGKHPRVFVTTWTACCVLNSNKPAPLSLLMHWPSAACTKPRPWQNGTQLLSKYVHFSANTTVKSSLCKIVYPSSLPQPELKLWRGDFTSSASEQR